jgi:hypothetical protein
MVLYHETQLNKIHLNLNLEASCSVQRIIGARGIVKILN